MQAEARRERTGSSRVALVTSLLADRLDIGAGSVTATASRPPRVLDCGGGSGAYAVPLAIAGADVTVVDISADALATLRRRADEAGASSRVHAVAGDIDALDELVGDTRFDAVLAHGIFDTGNAVSSIGDSVAAMASLLGPGGLLSVVVANPVAGVIARALAGEPVLALAELRRLSGASESSGSSVSDVPPVGFAARSLPDAVVEFGAHAGLDVVARNGIGAFSDLVPGSAGETAGGREAVAALDAEAAGFSPFAELAGRLHLVLRRPD